VAGAIRRETTEPLYLDLKLESGVTLDLPIRPRTMPSFTSIRLAVGAAGSETRAAEAGRMAVLTNAVGSAGVTVRAEQGSRFLLIAGKPLNEPIAQWGPFVMNTREQVEAAIDDFAPAVSEQHSLQPTAGANQARRTRRAP
jgi:redox-sensitive bicupin YhaK (pirin superfamily)